MQTILEAPPCPIDEVPDVVARPIEITLVDGKRLDISRLNEGALVRLQCEQEPAFARAIAQSPKDSSERQRVTSQAYSSICALLEQQAAVRRSTGEFSMGMDPRYSDLILRLMQRQSGMGRPAALFEVGFSSGGLLQTVAEQGVNVGGVEVVEDLFEQTKRKLSAVHHDRLLLGDFRKLDLSQHLGQYSLVYWNDVFEHIATDEILDYLQVAHSLLCEGGLLVTITPNWHMRPSDVTADFCPPRTEAIGFHLKEYTLGEVCGLVSAAGFRSVAVPAYVSRHRIHLWPRLRATRLKVLVEPLLEWLPYRLAVQVCRRFGLNCTIATK